MFWRGNSSPAGFFNANGWYLGQAVPIPVPGRDTECDEGSCYPIVSRISQEQGAIILEKISTAKNSGSSCVLSAGPKDVLDRLTAKLQGMSMMMGPLVSAGLRQDEADYISKFESCLSLPFTGTAQVSPGAPDSSNIPWLPIGIGAGALVLIAALS